MECFRLLCHRITTETTMLGMYSRLHYIVTIKPEGLLSTKWGSVRTFKQLQPCPLSDRLWSGAVNLRLKNIRQLSFVADVKELPEANTCAIRVGG